MITIKNGDKELLFSSSMIIDSLLETSILFEGKSESLSFTLKFIVDKNTNEQFGVNWQSINNEAMLIELTNWNHISPVTLTEFQNIGSIDNRELFIIFSAASIGTGSMMEVMFSAYTGRTI
jgi:hypothetical protein